MSHPLLDDEFLVPERSAASATRALFVSLLGFVFFPVAILGVVLGVRALRRADHRPDLFGGRKRAAAAITLGCIGTLTCSPVGFGVLMPALARARENARHIKSGTMLKRIGEAMTAYGEKYGGFPAGGSDVGGRLREEGGLDEGAFNTPIARRESGETGYFYCPAPAAADAGERARTVLMFENPRLCERDGIVNVLYQDGQVRRVPMEQAKGLLGGLVDLWTPTGARVEAKGMFGEGGASGR